MLADRRQSDYLWSGFSKEAGVDTGTLADHGGLLIAAALFLVFAGIVGQWLRRRAEAMARGWLEAQGMRPLIVQQSLWKRANPKYILRISSSQSIVLARALDERGRTHEYLLLLGGFFVGPIAQRVEVLESRILD